MSELSEKYDVSVVACDSYDAIKVKEALRTSIDAVDGLSFMKPGIKVAVKVNLVAAKHPDRAATTHPALVTALCEMLFEKGAASVVVGDSPGGLYDATRLNAIYARTGMREVEKTGAKLNFDFSVKEAQNPNGVKLKDFKYTAYLDDADAIIDFAKLKTHGMMTMTGAVKNMFGTIPGTTKPEYHCRFPDRDDFTDMIIDLYEYFSPKLTIVDAIYGMEGNGPTAGTPRFIGAVIAAKRAYDADLAGAAIMELNTDRVPIPAHSYKRGLCQRSVEDIRVFGNVDDFRIDDYNIVEEPSVDLSKAIPGYLNKIMKQAFRTRPTLDKKKCVGCRECYNTCPRHAITMVDNKPKFDYKLCIRCFCCQEFCPKGALTVKRSIVARILNGK